MLLEFHNSVAGNGVDLKLPARKETDTDARVIKEEPLGKYLKGPHIKF